MNYSGIKINRVKPPAPQALPSEENTDYIPIFSNFVVSKKPSPLNMKLNIKSQVKMTKKMPSQTPIMCISQLVGPQKVAPKTPGICFYSKRNSEDYATADIEVGQS